MIFDNRYYRVESIFGYRLRALEFKQCKSKSKSFPSKSESNFPLMLTPSSNNLSHPMMAWLIHSALTVWFAPIKEKSTFTFPKQVFLQKKYFLAVTQQLYRFPCYSLTHWLADSTTHSLPLVQNTPKGNPRDFWPETWHWLDTWNTDNISGN